MITTHILDVSRGKPARGMPVMLEYFADGESWRKIGSAVSDSNGRVKKCAATNASVVEGLYRLTFYTSSYFKTQNIESFYPEVTVTFIIKDAKQHYHVPLLLSPFGFTTYRGS